MHPNGAAASRAATASRDVSNARLLAVGVFLAIAAQVIAAPRQRPCPYCVTLKVKKPSTGWVSAESTRHTTT